MTNFCGSKGCKCKATPAKKHGPYYQLSFTKNGKCRSEFVNKENANMVSRQVKNYASLRKLVDKWVESGTELSDLRILDQKKIAWRGGGPSRELSSRQYLLNAFELTKYFESVNFKNKNNHL